MRSLFFVSSCLSHLPNSRGDSGASLSFSVIACSSPYRWCDAPAGKAEWFREVEARHELHGFLIESIVKRPFNDVCVALVLSTQTVTWRGERQDLRFRYTDVWRRVGDRWLLSVRHASIVPAHSPTSN